MQKCALFVSAMVLLIPAAWAAVNVSSPGSGSTVQSPVHFSASAGGTSCSTGVASMGIYTAPGVLAYVVKGTTLSTDLSLSAGTYNATVQQWDRCGGSSKTAITIKVISSSAKTFYNLESSKGWKGYGELPPKYDICSYVFRRHLGFNAGSVVSFHGWKIREILDRRIDALRGRPVEQPPDRRWDFARHAGHQSHHRSQRSRLHLRHVLLQLRSPQFRKH